MPNHLRLAARRLLRSPGFTGAAVVSLAVGLGVVAAVLGIVDGVLLRPLPYPEAETVYRLRHRWQATPRGAISPAESFDYADALREIAAFGVYTRSTVTVAAERPERLVAGFASPGALAALGYTASRGRMFDEEDDRPGSAVALVSDGFWRRHLGGSAQAVGRVLRVDGESVTVVGVLAPGDRLPQDLASGETTELYLPLAIERSSVAERGSHFLDGVLRLRAGVSAERAVSVVEATARGFSARFPDDYPAEMGFAAYLVPLVEDVVGDTRPLLLSLLAAAGLVLLVASANVTSLMISRVESRRRELAVRQALGAGRWRAGLPTVWEAALLSLAGTVGGLLLAAGALRALAARRIGGLPRLAEAEVGLAVVGVAALLACLVAAAVGLVPGHVAGKRLADTLRTQGVGASGGRSSRRWRAVLVVGQLALALALLDGAGLLVRSVAGLWRVDAGYRIDGVLTARLSLPEAEYPSDASRRAFFAALVERLQGLPEVVAAGAATNLPLDGSGGDLNVELEGQELPPDAVSPALEWQAVTPGLFDALGMRLVRGRGLEPADDERAPGAVVINRAAERLLFPAAGALGRRFRLGGGAGPGWVTVVGVVDDVRRRSLAEPPRAEMYLAHRQFRFWHGGPAPASMAVVLRSAGDPASLAAALRREVAALDSALALGPPRTMRAVAADSISRPRLTMAALSVAGLLGLALATLGVYALAAHGVRQRLPEFGIRIALGGRPRDVAALVLRESLALAAAGALLGALAATAATRWVRSLLFAVEPGDPAVLALAASALVLAAALAALLPARAAARVDPMAAMRSD